MFSQDVRNKNSLKKLLILVTMCYYFDVIVSKGEDSETIHLLMWDSSQLPPALGNEDGTLFVISTECTYTNCHVTNNITSSDIKNFDVILFNSLTLNNQNATIPSERLKRQKYVLMSNEPSGLTPIPSQYNEFFNLTWTYKLDSDSPWRYFMIEDDKDDIIGPARNIQWMDFDNMVQINNATEVQLQNKTKAAAWYPTQCKTRSKREDFVTKLKHEFKKYKLKLDIYGPCASSKNNISKFAFYDLLETDYYFYLAFEKLICEDYVTDEVLAATDHFAVPIVYGGADYTRFLPPGSYINAYTLGLQVLAAVINETIHNRNLYYDYFKWQNHYTIHAQTEGSVFNDVCRFCDYLNEIKSEFLYKTRVYTDMTTYWTCNSQRSN